MSICAKVEEDIDIYIRQKEMDGRAQVVYTDNESNTIQEEQYIYYKFTSLFNIEIHQRNLPGELQLQLHGSPENLYNLPTARGNTDC